MGPQVVTPLQIQFILSPGGEPGHISEEGGLNRPSLQIETEWPTRDRARSLSPYSTALVQGETPMFKVGLGCG